MIDGDEGAPPLLGNGLLAQRSLVQNQVDGALVDVSERRNAMPPACSIVHPGLSQGGEREVVHCKLECLRRHEA